MMYDIAALPTRYAGVEFRSRLEARWAAYFNLSRWQWDYEPIDLQGWTPDFTIVTPFCRVFAEVKPVDVDAEGKTDPAFQKAFAHWSKVQVLLLGLAPAPQLYGMGCAGALLDNPPGAKYFWSDVHAFLRSEDAEVRWREAGNMVQWKPRSGR
jgi:hypothetical protein